MRTEDFEEFASLLDATFDMIGKSPAAKLISPGAKALFFEDMRRFPLPLVRSALAAHRADGERGKWTPSPADLIFQIERHQKRDNRPGAEEAWAIALTTMDDQNTVVWTQEAAEAFAKARPVLESSGAISARKTFLEVYERLVAISRQAGVAVHWFPSPGLDKVGYEAAVKKAVAAGLLAAPTPAPAALLEAPAKPETFCLSPREQLAFLHKKLAEGAAAKLARLDAAADARVEAEDKITTKIQDQVRQYRQQGARSC